MSGFNLNDILNKRSKESVAPVWNFKPIPLEQIVPSPHNKYRICDIEEMADSIETDGLLHNLAVRKLPDSGLYELISGERRFRALQMLVARGKDGYALAPCKVEVEQSDVIAEIKLLRANSTARNLTDSERVYQANRLKELLTDLKKSGVKVQGRVRNIVAKELDISAAQVGRMESINDKLIPEVKAEFEKGNINMTAAYETSRLPADKQAEVIKDLQQGAKVDIKTVKRKRDPLPATAPVIPAAKDEPPDTPSCPPSYCGTCISGDCIHHQHEEPAPPVATPAPPDNMPASSFMDDIILSPCPFCGGESKTDATMNAHSKTPYYVRCKSCKACGPRKETKELAAEAWNRRHAPERESGVVSK